MYFTIFLLVSVHRPRPSLSMLSNVCEGVSVMLYFFLAQAEGRPFSRRADAQPAVLLNLAHTSLWESVVRGKETLPSYPLGESATHHFQQLSRQSQQNPLLLHGLAIGQAHRGREAKPSQEPSHGGAQKSLGAPSCPHDLLRSLSLHGLWMSHFFLQKKYC